MKTIPAGRAPFGHVLHRAGVHAYPNAAFADGNIVKGSEHARGRAGLDASPGSATQCLPCGVSYLLWPSLVLLILGTGGGRYGVFTPYEIMAEIQAGSGLSPGAERKGKTPKAIPKPPTSHLKAT